MPSSFSGISIHVLGTFFCRRLVAQFYRPLSRLLFKPPFFVLVPLLLKGESYEKNNFCDFGFAYAECAGI